MERVDSDEGQLAKTEELSQQKLVAMLAGDEEGETGWIREVRAEARRVADMVKLRLPSYCSEAIASVIEYSNS